MKKLFMILLALPMMAACATGTTGSGTKSTVTEAELLHHRYVLTSVNGKPFHSTDRTPEIEFNEGMRVSGQVCNRFTGNGSLAKGKLVVAEMASTMMLCADPQLNQLERDFSAMLREGATVQLKDNRSLTLAHDSLVLEYTVGDWVQ